MLKTTMSHPSEQDIEVVRQRCQVVARWCGLNVQVAIAEMEASGAFLVTLYHETVDLSFNILVRLADAFASEDMRLDCNLGTSSDRTHNPFVAVKWSSFERAVLLVRKDLKESDTALLGVSTG